MIVLAVTDFPEPDSPMMQRISPTGRSKDMSSTAWGRSMPGGRSTVRWRTESTKSAGTAIWDMRYPLCHLGRRFVTPVRHTEMMDGVHYLVQS